jgi:hypothetical protein
MTLQHPEAASRAQALPARLRASSEIKRERDPPPRPARRPHPRVLPSRRMTSDTINGALQAALAAPLAALIQTGAGSDDRSRRKSAPASVAARRHAGARQTASLLYRVRSACRGRRSCRSRETLAMGRVNCVASIDALSRRARATTRCRGETRSRRLISSPSAAPEKTPGAVGA